MPRTRVVLLAAVACCVTLAPPVPAQRAGADSLAAESRSALARATAFLRSISAGGGYLWRYSEDLQQRAGEVAATATQIWVQAPGTPAVGEAFLRAFAVTRDRRHLEAARAAAEALVLGQLESGGWDYVIELDPAQRGRWRYRTQVGTPAPEVAQPKNRSTYDDDNTQGAIRFLLAFLDAARVAPAPRDAAIREAVDYALRKLVEAQYPNGAWPQAWTGEPHDPARFPVKAAAIPAEYAREHPAREYAQLYTLNDAAHLTCVSTLLDAYRRTGRAEYLAAAKRGGDFLLLAQLPEPQPVWAQQYDTAMAPAWARTFEPPSVSSSESARAMRTLLELYQASGDARYLQGLRSAIAWFRRSEIAPGRWARLYELRTNRPIYGDRDGKIHHRLEEISLERQRGYGWQGAFGIPAAIAEAERVLADPAAARTRRGGVQEASSAVVLARGARAVIDALDAKGRWLTTQRIDGRDGRWILTRTFIENVETLSRYLELASARGTR